MFILHKAAREGQLQFVEYLINNVGFTGGEIIGTPQHSALGFRRAIYVSFTRT